MRTNSFGRMIDRELLQHISDESDRLWAMC